MHRPQSTAESTPPVLLWLRTHGWQALVLAVLYFLFGHASFLVQVDDVLVTPVLFAPEGIALAMALRFGAAVWPGIFAGQLALALSLGLAPLPAVAISAVNSIEAVMAVFLFRSFRLDVTLPRARDLAGLLLLIFFVLQPFSATLGNAALWASGIVDRAELPSSWLNWWIGNSFGQMLVTPLLLALLAGGRTKLPTAGDFLVPVLAISPVVWIADFLLRWTGVSSLLVVLAPILVLLALYRGLVAVCVGSMAIAVSALYATSHAFGPFVVDGQANIPDLNLFIIGLAMGGQFLAVFLRQAKEQQRIADELRADRERLQQTAYELTENIPVGTYVLEFNEAGAPRFTFVSDRFLAMTGLTREEVMANHAMALLPMSLPGREEIERINREVFAEKKRFFWEGEITVRGVTRSVTLESVPRDRPGGGTVWEGVLTDITERKAAEEKIARSETALRNALDTLPFAVGMCGASPSHADPEARIVFLNRNFVETFGYTLADLPTAAAWANAAYPDETRRREVFAWWDQAVQRLMTRQSVVETHESRAVTKRGLPLDIVVSATMLEDKLVVSFLDITERKKAEAQLQRVLDNLPIAVAATTLTSPAAMPFINEEFTRTFGYTLEDVPTVAAWAEKAYPDPAYRQEVFREWDEAASRAIETKGSVESMEFEVTGKDGTKRDVIFRAVVLDDSLLISMTDVTEPKRAEQQLTEAHRNMQLSASAARLGFWELDVDTGIDHWDEEMARINGIRLADFDGHWEKFVHPDDHDEVMRETRRMLESDTIFGMEYRLRRPNGEVRHVRERGIVTRDEKGRALKVNGVLQDITEEKEAAQQLRQSAQRMQLAAAAAGIGFWSRDLNSQLEQWDDQMRSIYGVRREDFDGRWEPFVHPDDLEQVQAATEQALRRGMPGRYEYRIIRPDGTVRHLRGMSVAVRDEHGEPSREIGVNFDITEEKAATAREKQLEAQYRRDLETKLKTSLTAAAVAHEINQPLSGILLQSRMALQQGTGEGEALRVIAEEARRVVVTIDKMKTLLRSVQTEQRGIDLSEVVQSALLYTKGLLARDRIKLSTAGLDQPCLIKGDDEQLQLAITNLVRNAAEAIAEAKPKKREINVRLTKQADAIELAIGDSGPGWPEDGPAEVPLTTTKKAGTGIGLYIVRTAMENHRGEIVFGRSPLGGAEVKLRFARVEK